MGLACQSRWIRAALTASEKAPVVPSDLIKLLCGGKVCLNFTKSSK